MEKKNKIIAFVAIMAIAISFTGCSSDDEIVNSNYPEDNIVRVEANVNDMTTRGSVETSTLNNMSLTIYNAKNSKYCYNNIKVTKGADGTWTPAEMMLWENKDNSVYVLAYSPYKEDQKDHNIIWSNEEGVFYDKVPVSVAEVQTAEDISSDFIVYKETNFNPGSQLSTRSAIPIAFKHVMSQLILTVKLGTEFDNPTKLTANPITDLKVSGTVIESNCDFGTGVPMVLSNPLGTVKDVTPYTSKGFVQATGDNGHEVTNAEQEFSCILIPQIVAANNFSISFTINGKTYKWTSPTEVKLEGGKKHTLELTVGKDYVVAGNINATPWGNGGESNLYTD